MHFRKLTNLKRFERVIKINNDLCDKLKRLKCRILASFRVLRVNEKIGRVSLTLFNDP